MRVSCCGDGVGALAGIFGWVTCASSSLFSSPDHEDSTHATDVRDSDTRRPLWPRRSPSRLGPAARESYHRAMSTPTIDIEKLAPEERLHLIEDLWESYGPLTVVGGGGRIHLGNLRGDPCGTGRSVCLGSLLWQRLDLPRRSPTRVRLGRPTLLISPRAQASAEPPSNPRRRRALSLIHISEPTRPY